MVTMDEWGCSDKLIIMMMLNILINEMVGVV